MKELIVRQYIADAFTDTVFKGNPAAICLLQNWISDEMMQNISLRSCYLGNGLHPLQFYRKG